MGSNTHFFLAQMEIIEKITELVSNLLKEKGLELVDITYRRESAGMVLRLILDKKGPPGSRTGPPGSRTGPPGSRTGPPERDSRAGGITIDECGLMNEELSALLDKDDFIPESYVLEVSSPGLDRPLKTKRDFDRVIGEMVRIVTYGPVEEKREHIGRVSSCEEGYVAIELKDADVIRKIPMDKISKARLEIEF